MEHKFHGNLPQILIRVKGSLKEFFVFCFFYTTAICKHFLVASYHYHSGTSTPLSCVAGVEAQKHIKIMVDALIFKDTTLLAALLGI